MCNSMRQRDYNFTRRKQQKVTIIITDVRKLIPTTTGGSLVWGGGSDLWGCGSETRREFNHWRVRSENQNRQWCKTFSASPQDFFTDSANWVCVFSACKLTNLFADALESPREISSTYQKSRSISTLMMTTDWLWLAKPTASEQRNVGLMLKKHCT